MGFMNKINKVGKFFDKGLHKAEGFGQKVLKGADKGLNIASKIVNVADQVAGTLENVPVVGGIASELRPALRGGKNALIMGEKGINKANKVLHKID